MLQSSTEEGSQNMLFGKLFCALFGALFCVFVLKQRFKVDELACFSETSRQRAFERFELLRAHLEDGRSLAAIAREARLSSRTLQYWLERYRTSGLIALARKPRTDRGRRRKVSAAVQEVIEGLPVQKPPPLRPARLQISS